MVKEELIENGQRVRHWSDKSLKIRQVETGVIYDDAADVLPCRYSYEETETPIEEAAAELFERHGMEV